MLTRIAVLVSGGGTNLQALINARAAGKMTPDQRRRMLEMLRGSFAEAFRNTASDDLDDTEEEYLDERV